MTEGYIEPECSKKYITEPFTEEELDEYLKFIEQKSIEKMIEQDSDKKEMYENAFKKYHDVIYTGRFRNYIKYFNAYHL